MISDSIRRAKTALRASGGRSRTYGLSFAISFLIAAALCMT